MFLDWIQAASCQMKTSLVSCFIFCDDVVLSKMLAIWSFFFFSKIVCWLLLVLLLRVILQIKIIRGELFFCLLCMDIETISQHTIEVGLMDNRLTAIMWFFSHILFVILFLAQALLCNFIDIKSLLIQPADTVCDQIFKLNKCFYFLISSHLFFFFLPLTCLHAWFLNYYIHFQLQVLDCSLRARRRCQLGSWRGTWSRGQRGHPLGPRNRCWLGHRFGTRNRCRLDCRQGTRSWSRPDQALWCWELRGMASAGARLPSGRLFRGWL